MRSFGNIGSASLYRYKSLCQSVPIDTRTVSSETGEDTEYNTDYSDNDSEWEEFYPAEEFLE